MFSSVARCSIFTQPTAPKNRSPFKMCFMCDEGVDMHVCMKCVCACVQVRGWPIRYILRYWRVFHLNPELANLSSIASQLALSLPCLLGLQVTTKPAWSLHGCWYLNVAPLVANSLLNYLITELGSKIERTLYSHTYRSLLSTDHLLPCLDNRYLQNKTKKHALALKT